MRTTSILAITCALFAAACTKSPEPATKAAVAKSSPVSIAWVNTKTTADVDSAFSRAHRRQEARLPFLDGGVVPAMQSRQVDHLHA